MTTTPTPRPVPTREDRLAAARNGNGPRLTYLEAAALDERDQLDARAATAEQERDDLADDLQALRTHHAETERKLHTTENDLRSQTRAVRELQAELTRARDTTQRCWQIVKGAAAERDQARAERDTLVETIGRLISLPPQQIAEMHHVGYGPPPAGLGSPHRAQEDPAEARRRHALVFNAITRTLAGRRHFIPLSMRERCAEAVLAALDAADDYHARGVYCGEPAHCDPPHPGALPGEPYPERQQQPEYHWGRAWSPTADEAACPCPKAPCGYVIRSSEPTGCELHGPMQTMRGGHPADRCPGKREG